MIWSNFPTIIWEVLHKKPSFWHSKNGKWFFRPKKKKTSLGNIVCHPKMHPCAKYEIIWTNYAMNVAIRLIIWLESHESSRMIAHFWEHFFQNNCRITSLLFFLATWSHIMTQCEGFLIFWFFFEFFMPVSKCGQNSGLDRSYLVVESWNFFGVSLIK